MKRTRSHTSREQGEMSFASDAFNLAGPVARNIDGTPLSRLTDQTAPAAELLPERDHGAKIEHDARAWWTDGDPARTGPTSSLFS